MKLPSSTLIEGRIITDYLLRLREDDDKSGFLALGGYGAKDAERLLRDLRDHLLSLEAERFEETQYGPKYRIRGVLTGPNGRVLRVVTIWMTENATGETKFVTLFPDE